MNTDDAAINLDGIDQRAQVGLPEWDGSGGDILAHQGAEAFDFGCVDAGSRHLAFDPVQCTSRPIAIGLDVGKASFQNLVEIGDAVLHEPVEAPELFLGGNRLPRQMSRFSTSPLAFTRRSTIGKERGDPVRNQQTIGNMAGYQLVQLVIGLGRMDTKRLRIRSQHALAEAGRIRRRREVMAGLFRRRLRGLAMIWPLP